MGRRLRRLLSAALLGALLAGCGGSTTARPSVSPTPSFTSLRVVRTEFYPTIHVPAFSETVTRAGDIARLYAEIQRLPLDGGGSSPIYDSAVSYELTFLRDNAVVFTAVAEPYGRSLLILADCRFPLSIQTATFWPAFFAATGLSQETLMVGPALTPPYAPRPSLPTIAHGHVYPPCPSIPATPTGGAGAP